MNENESSAVELVFSNGEGEVVIGPFGSVLADDTTIYEPVPGSSRDSIAEWSRDRSIAEWTYSDGPAGEHEGWEIQRHGLRDERYGLVQVRGATKAAS